MADAAHLEILKRGGHAWNRWREENPTVVPNLREADFRGADLREANLSRARLGGAHLGGAHLGGADLRRTDLGGADLSGAYLRGVYLIGAALSGADLGGAHLGGAHLGGADLSRVTLSGADLGGAHLSGADLTHARCAEANFSNASLRLARLISTNLDGATLTAAHLWETQRTGWSIKRVICESVYWDAEGKELTTYSPGEFQRLHSDKTKIVLFYKGGLSPLEFSALPALVKHLEESRPGYTLRLESINDAPGGAIVTLAVEDASDGSPEGLKQLKIELEAAAAQVIEYQRLALAERETRLRLEGGAEELRAIVKESILLPSLSVHNQGIITMGDKYNVGQAGAVGPQSHAHDMTFQQVGGNIESAMDLSELAAELATLRRAMKSEATEPEHDAAVGEVAKAEQAATAKDSSKVAESLKAAGEWALDVATKIGTSLASEALKESLGIKK
jgi:uncharacterized protein YjbI with pentapeptide repeats